MLTLWSYQPPGNFPLPRPRWLLTPLWRGALQLLCPAGGTPPHRACLPPGPRHQRRGERRPLFLQRHPCSASGSLAGTEGAGVWTPGSACCAGRLASSRWEPRGRGFCDAVQEEVPRGQLVLPGRETQPCQRTGGEGACVVGCPCQGHSLHKTGPGDRE